MSRDDPEFRSMRGRNITFFPSTWFQEFRMFIERQRVGKCDAHWGRHSCDNPLSHKFEHRCVCGAHPHAYSVLWGTNAEIDDLEVRQERLAKHEEWASWADPFDKDGNYRPERKRRGLKNELRQKSAA
jgi:hypothetical protein